MLVVACQEGTQKLLEHEGNTEGGVAWQRQLDEYVPRTAGRQCALLQEVLRYGFPGDPRTASAAFEVLLRQCSTLSGEDVSETFEDRIDAERHHGQLVAKANVLWAMHERVQLRHDPPILRLSSTANRSAFFV